MRYVVIGFCVFAVACAGASPTAPTSSATTSSASQIGRGSVTTEAKGASELPFKGDLQATEAVVGTVHDLTGAGNGTLLGRFTYAAHIIVDPETGDGVGTVTWTAANDHDQIFADTQGELVLFAPPTITLKETQSITGGTGRFAGASGTIIVERSLDLPTQVTTGSYNGSINLAH